MKKLNGLDLKGMYFSGTNALINNSERIDSLNVFPVPDGDTGSNMSSSVDYASEDLRKKESNSVGEVAKVFSRGMLLGARGNSGVILSQIFKGISTVLESKREATLFDIVEAFSAASEYAYKSVMTPIEGTILTVIRMISENLKKTVTPSNSIEEIFEYIKNFSREATENTPNLLPVLKEVGVVDSGGEGLTIFLEGMHLYLLGKPVEKGEKAKGQFGKLDILSDDDHEGEFGYCTEFILDLKIPKSFNKNKFEKALIRFGNSLVLVHDEDVVKIHIHSHRPGDVLSFAMRFGEFLKIKIDNMTLQANESKSSKMNFTSKPPGLGKGGIAVISCNTGQGIINDMKEMGTHFIIESGQSSNPSAKDFIEAIKETNAEKIIILPNNSNIILAAQQVAQTSDKEVIIVPSKTQMQGLSAMINFDPDSSMKENQENMEEAIESVQTGQVTKAARTTKIEGVNVREGEYLAIANRKIIKSTNSKVESASEVAKKLITEDTELVTIYYGDDSTETDAEELSSFIENNFEVEVEIKNGNQQIYNFLISFE